MFKTPSRFGRPMRVPTLLLLALVLAPAALPPAGAGPADVAVTVPSDGSTVSVNVPPGTYTIAASGTYAYSTDPFVADAAYSFQGSSTCYDWPGNNHDLLVNGVSPWAAPCNTATHTYTTTFPCTLLSCTIEFRILDDDYVDNSGSLAVTVTSVGPALPDACLQYNPAALTNVCLEWGTTTTSVPVVGVGTDPMRVCIVGPVCADAPVPFLTQGSAPATLPALHGFVEATVLCGRAVPCRVTLP